MSDPLSGVIFWVRVPCNFGRGVHVAFQVNQGATDFWFSVLIRYEDGDGDLAMVEVMEVPIVPLLLLSSPSSIPSSSSPNSIPSSSSTTTSWNGGRCMAVPQPYSCPLCLKSS